MKKYSIIYSVLFLVIVFSACKKEMEGDNYLKGELLPSYVTPALDAISIQVPTKDTTIGVTLTTRRAFQRDVTVTYNVSGAVTLTNQTAKITGNNLTGTGTIAVPKGASATGEIVVTFTKAVTADNEALRLGSQGAVDVPVVRKVTIN